MHTLVRPTKFDEGWVLITDAVIIRAALGPVNPGLFLPGPVAYP